MTEPEPIAPREHPCWKLLALAGLMVALGEIAVYLRHPFFSTFDFLLYKFGLEEGATRFLGVLPRMYWLILFVAKLDADWFGARVFPLVYGAVALTQALFLLGPWLLIRNHPRRWTFATLWLFLYLAAWKNLTAPFSFGIALQYLLPIPFSVLTFLCVRRAWNAFSPPAAAPNQTAKPARGAWIVWLAVAGLTGLAGLQVSPRYIVPVAAAAIWLFFRYFDAPQTNRRRLLWIGAGLVAAGGLLTAFCWDLMHLSSRFRLDGLQELPKFALAYSGWRFGWIGLSLGTALLVPTLLRNLRFCFAFPLWILATTVGLAVDVALFCQMENSTLAAWLDGGVLTALCLLPVLRKDDRSGVPGFLALCFAALFFLNVTFNMCSYTRETTGLGYFLLLLAWYGADSLSTLRGWANQAGKTLPSRTAAGIKTFAAILLLLCAVPALHQLVRGRQAAGDMARINDANRAGWQRLRLLADTAPGLRLFIPGNRDWNIEIALEHILSQYAAANVTLDLERTMSPDLAAFPVLRLYDNPYVYKDNFTYSELKLTAEDVWEKRDLLRNTGWIDAWRLGERDTGTLHLPASETAWEIGVYVYKTLDDLHVRVSPAVLLETGERLTPSGLSESVSLVDGSPRCGSVEFTEYSFRIPPAPGGKAQTITVSAKPGNSTVKGTNPRVFCAVRLDSHPFSEAEHARIYPPRDFFSAR